MYETTFKFSLDTSGKKIQCSQCGQKRAVRYRDNTNGNFLPDKVSRCDRENTCGYHYTPKQFFAINSHGYTPVANIKMTEVLETEIINHVPLEFINASMMGCEKASFSKWLISSLGYEIASQLQNKYFIGRSKNDCGHATVFWRIDKDGQCRTGKIMQYNPINGKRNKDSITTWVHTSKKQNGEYLFPQPFNFKLCFFGEHLINEHPDKTIGIVESEKTAVIASVFMPDFIWLATGGNSGCKWREWSVYNVLKNRNVILFPDYGYYNRKTLKTCFEEWSDRANAIMERMNCKIKVSRILEERFKNTERLDWDIADVLISQENGNGMALTDYNYPVVFDLQKLSTEQLSDLIKQYVNN